LGYVLGVTQGKEYAEPEWYVDLWLALVWVLYLAAFAGTLVKREEPHIYVAILTTRPNGITEWRVLVTTPAARHLPASLPISFHLHDQAGHDMAHAQSVLLGPAP